MAAGVVAAIVALFFTVGVGLELKPDVSLYLEGFALYPSPIGTLVGELGRPALALCHAVAVGALVWLLWELRPRAHFLVMGVPLVWWLIPLGVDAIAAALLVAGLVYGRPWASWLAVGVHLAALPIVAAALFQRRRRWALAAIGAGVIGLLVTPYGSSISLDPLSILEALPRAGVVLSIALAPLLLVRELELVLPAAFGVAVVVLYATTSHVEDGIDPALSIFAASRYALPLSLLVLVVSTSSSSRSYGRRRRPTTVATEGVYS